jgi:hypothetical protein
VLEYSTIVVIDVYCILFCESPVPFCSIFRSGSSSLESEEPRDSLDEDDKARARDVPRPDFKAFGPGSGVHKASPRHTRLLVARIDLLRREFRVLGLGESLNNVSLNGESLPLCEYASQACRRHHAAHEKMKNIRAGRASHA